MYIGSRLNSSWQTSASAFLYVVLLSLRCLIVVEAEGEYVEIEHHNGTRVEPCDGCDEVDVHHD